jgi:hypothetical protein
MDDVMWGKQSYTLCLSNIEETAFRIEKMLTGKRYTFVAANEFFRFEPEVRTGQRLTDKNPMHFWFDEENTPPKYGGFNFNDSYGVWGLSTSQEGEQYDPKFDAPYLVFEWGHKLTMTLRAPAGHLIYWVIAVEDDDER